jgi:hypothetical protein
MMAVRSRGWILDAALSPYYLMPYCELHQKIFGWQFKAMMETLAMRHGRGQTLAGERVSPDDIKRVANKIMTKFRLPVGFDDTGSLFLASASPKAEPVIRRCERILMCFLYGLMRRRMPHHGGTAALDLEHRCPRFAPLLTLDSTGMKTFFGFTGASSHTEFQRHLAWKKSLLAHLDVASLCALRRTCHELRSFVGEHRFGADARDPLERAFEAAFPGRITLPTECKHLTSDCTFRIWATAFLAAIAAKPAVVTTSLRFDASTAKLHDEAIARGRLGTTPARDLSPVMATRAALEWCRLSGIRLTPNTSALDILPWLRESLAAYSLAGREVRVDAALWERRYAIKQLDTGDLFLLVFHASKTTQFQLTAVCIDIFFGVAWLYGTPTESLVETVLPLEAPANLKFSACLGSEERIRGHREEIKKRIAEIARTPRPTAASHRSAATTAAQNSGMASPWHSLLVATPSSR